MKATIDELIAQMTLDEKAQLCSGQDIWRLKTIKWLDMPQARMCDGPSGLRLQNDQDNHLGVNASEPMVCYPAGSAYTASFDRTLIHAQGAALGEECQSSNISVVLGPAANIKRSPLCGRNFEYLSEDPYLAGEVASAQIQGIQSQNVGACMKHFACNNQEDWRMWADSIVDERTMREIYLPAFETAVKTAKPWAIMCSYNRLNGTYTSEHPWLLNDLLRDEWGFEGMVVSDWGAVNDRVAALKAGLDLEMPGGNLDTDRAIAAAVRDGSMDEAVLDKAVKRILQMVYRFDETRTSQQDFDREDHHALAVRIAQESAVLLKNQDALLPLNPKTRIAFIGEYAKKPRFLGGGSACVTPFKLTNALDCAATFAAVGYAQGFPAEGDEENPAWFAQAVEVAKEAQVAVVFAGLPDSYESECWDRHHMQLPACQNRLIEAVCDVQPNVVVVLHNGSPIEMPWLGRVKGVLEMYISGQGVGEATTNLLFGKANPCGKLPETFPKKLADNPSYLNFPGDGNTIEYREGIYVGYRYYDKKQMEVLFPFGFGLSYTSFAYSNLRLSSTCISDTGCLTVTVDVTNTGRVAGKEIVQLYVSDKTGSYGRPIRELKGFEKLSLEPGETKNASFVLDSRSFSWYCADCHDWVCPSGAFAIEVGASSRNILLCKTVTVQSCTKRPIIITMNTLMASIWQFPKLAAHTTQVLRNSSHQVETFMTGDDETSVYLRGELMELPFHAIRGLYEVPQAQLDLLIQQLNQMVSDEQQ